MKQHHENLLIATLAGLVVAGAAAMFIAPVSAADHTKDTVGRVVNAKDWDQLNMRNWPAQYAPRHSIHERNHL